MRSVSILVAALVAAPSGGPKVDKLYCIDASVDALVVARRNLAAHLNCELVEATVAEPPFTNGSMDFGYSLGVLHHVPDTAAGIASCAVKLKAGAPLKAN